MNVTTAKELLSEITKRRKALKIDAVSLASLSGVSLKFLSQLENGKESIETTSLLKVTGSLGIQIPFLDEPESLGKLISTRRKELDIDQLTTATMCGVSARFLSTIERGEPRKRLNKVFNVIHGLGLSVEVIY